MARVAVLHNTLDLRGGADAVCLRVCAALQADHDVVLVTLSQSSLSDLNVLFDTDVQVPVHRPPGTATVSRAIDRLPDRCGPALEPRSVLLRYAFGRHAEEFDLAVSTANEFDLPVPSVQYVHFPQFNVRHASAGTAGRLDAVWSRLAGLGSRTLPADATMLANSAWTADVVDEIYCRRPEVCFPPVDPVAGPRDWADRDEGIVTVGRLAPDNAVLRAIEIVDDVREQGHDVHLHVVGSTSPAYRRYVRRVRAAATGREHVHLETDAPRERLERLLATHKYGLGTKPEEHFGMAVAEFVAAGMLTFAPDAGGQREVLGGDERVLYGSVEEAVAKIAGAVESDAQPELPRDRFDVDRFAREIRETVERTLETRG